MDTGEAVQLTGHRVGKVGGERLFFLKMGHIYGQHGVEVAFFKKSNCSLERVRKFSPGRLLDLSTKSTKSTKQYLYFSSDHPESASQVITQILDLGDFPRITVTVNSAEVENHLHFTSLPGEMVQLD